MKYFIFILLTFSSLYSQATNLKIVVREDVKSVVLSKLEYGELIECKKLEALKSGSENVIENIESGQIYVIKSGMLSRYFCAPDDGLEVVIKEKQIELIAPRGLNLALNEWYLVSDSVRSQSSEFYRTPASKSDTTVFFTQYKKLQYMEVRIIEKYSKKLTDDKSEILHTIVKCDMDYFLFSYILNPLIATSFRSYSSIVKNKVREPFFNSDNILKYYPEAAIYSHKYATVARKFGLSSTKLLDKFKTNDLKALYVCREAVAAKTFSDIVRIKNRWGQYLTSPIFSERFDLIYDNLKRLSVGRPGFNFALPDVDGKIVKLSDLEGKVVLVDLWATWCGPCKREIPYLVKLKEEFKGKDLVIVGISVDKENAKEKWKKMARSIGGIQLLDVDNTVGSYYKCNAVPHFLLFDKKGKIASLDSPRPSNPKLKDKLNKLLQESN